MTGCSSLLARDLSLLLHCIYSPTEGHELPGALRHSIFQLIAIHNSLALKCIDPRSLAASNLAIKLLILALGNICAMTSYKPSAAHIYTYGITW